MSLSYEPNIILKENNARLLKNAIDSLLILRNISAPYDEETAALFNHAAQALRDLRKHLESTQEYPRWVDEFGIPSHWEHPAK